MRTLVVLSCCLAVAGFGSACGSDDEATTGGSSGSEFAAEVNAICTETARQQTEVELQAGPAATSSAEATGEVRAAMLEVREDELVQLEGLEPPEDQASDWNEYLAAEQDFVSLQEDLIEAEQAEDRAAIEELDAEQIAAMGEIGTLESDLGFDACARTLSEEQEQEVVAVSESTWASDDPDVVCEEAMTPEMIEHSFGTAEKCKKFQSDPSNIADGIEVRSVGGTPEVSATVEYEVIGGPEDGSVYNDALVYQDGAWVIYRGDFYGAASELPPPAEEASESAGDEEAEPAETESGYTEEARALFVKNCSASSPSAGGGSEEFCQCTIDYLAENLPFDDFKTPTAALDPALKDAAKQCAGL